MSIGSRASGPTQLSTPPLPFRGPFFFEASPHMIPLPEPSTCNPQLIQYLQPATCSLLANPVDHRPLIFLATPRSSSLAYKERGGITNGSVALYQCRAPP